jgi:hypothetical protein
MSWNEWSERSAYLFVKADREVAEKLWTGVQKWDAAIGSWMVTGPWDMLIWVDAANWEDLYRKVQWIRSQKGVKATSSHMVYKGAKNGKWWWEWPAGAWTLVRTPQLNGEIREIEKWPWAVSAASIPGDWDYLVWAGAKKWDDLWGHIWDLNKSGWHTETLIPIRSWWNKSWQKRWWT